MSAFDPKRTFDERPLDHFRPPGFTRYDRRWGDLGEAMRRREFIALTASLLAARPLPTHARQGGRPKIGVVLNYTQNDPEGEARISALQDRLSKRGWSQNNLDIEVRWAAGQHNLMLTYASEYISQPVDVIVINSTPLLSVVKPLTSTIPIVFAQVSDPIRSGFVSNYAHPEGNITGFTDLDVSIGGKWLELLKELVPSIDRVGVLMDPDQKNHPEFLHVIESAASKHEMNVFPANVHNRAEIEQSIASMAGAGHGLIVLPGPVNVTQRASIIQSAAQAALPAVYPFTYYAQEGGLLCYGINQIDQWVGMGDYVDRILRGEKTSNLPVQAPTNFDLVINLKTAKLLQLTVPQSLLAVASQVIE